MKESISVSGSDLALECVGVGVRYPMAEQWRPQTATWSAPRGSRTLLLGPSACGKSALALRVAGLIPKVLPAELRGSLQIMGRAVDERARSGVIEDVGIVFQDPDAQLFTQTVLDEVCFALENRLMPVLEIERRAREAIVALGLGPHTHRDPRVLSGGQRQRVAIACALACQPSLLVLDEPTANLDPLARRDLYRVLAELPEPDERAVILIEHNVDDAMGFVDRVVALGPTGETIVEGDVAEVFSEHHELLAHAGVALPASTRAYRHLAGLLPGEAIGQRPPLDVDGLSRLLRNLEGGREGCSQPRIAGGSPTSSSRSRDQRRTSIEVCGVRVKRSHRDPIEVLRGIDMSVAEGSFTAIVGVNGAGKSTLLRALAGVVAPTSGQIRVAGKPVRRRGRSAIGLVFQNPEHQFVEATVREELERAVPAGVPAAVRADRVAAILRRFELTESEDRHPSLLSGGQKRRLSVGIALLGGHRVIAFDEPTFGQDAEGTSEIMSMLVSLQAEGVTIVVVTHDLQLVAEHASDVIVMHDGLVTAAGAASEILFSSAIPDAGLCLPPLCEAALAAGVDVRRFADLTRYALDDGSDS